VKCEVLLFAQLREAIGRDRITIDLSEAATVSNALEILASQHRVINELRDKLAVAVNERYTRPEQTLNDGDVLALIPPVSGG
jgi:molybdopterin converting factor subunit 1